MNKEQLDYFARLVLFVEQTARMATPDDENPDHEDEVWEDDPDAVYELIHAARRLVFNAPSPHRTLTPADFELRGDDEDEDNA